MAGIEFYTFENELWAKYSDGRNEIVDESKTELVHYILNNVRECYPEAYSALERWYSNSSLNIKYYQYLMARRFIMCNFAQLDSTKIDVENVTAAGKFNFEKVGCPLRGECQYEGLVCCPKFNNKLSPAEYRVMEMVYKGRTKAEIATTLYNSPETIKNHIKSAYLKLGVHEKAEFIRYANEHNLFKS